MSYQFRGRSGRHSAGQIDAIYREISLPGSREGLGNYTTLDQEGRHIAARPEATFEEASRSDWQDGRGGAARLGHEDRADGVHSVNGLSPKQSY